MAYNQGCVNRKCRIWKEAEEKVLRECGIELKKLLPYLVETITEYISFIRKQGIGIINAPSAE